MDDALRQRLRQECDRYTQTVQALKALANEILWEDATRALVPGGTAYIGRRMDTSSANAISPATRVTPDLVVRRSRDYGLIAEAKLALPRESQHREPTISQVRKYDDDLVGWDTDNGLVSNHDIVLVVHHFQGNQLARQIKELVASGKLTFERKFALVKFAVVEQDQTWMSLELIYGSLTDRQKHEKLADTLAIGLEHIAAYREFATVRIYDYPPPDPLLMDLTHTAISSDLSQDDYLQLREQGVVRKPVGVGSLRQLLSESFGPGEHGERVPEIPTEPWVRKALDLFVALKWAEHDVDDPDRYVYIVKNRRKPFDQFLDLCVRIRQREAEKTDAERRKYPLLADLPDEEE